MTTKLRVKALYDCTADEPGELSFKEGEILVDVEESGEEGWYKGRIQHTSRIGLIPFNYVSPLSPTAQVADKEQSKGPAPKERQMQQQSTARVDAFEAAMSPGRRANRATALSPPSAINSKPSVDLASSGSATPPPIVSPKPKLAATVGLGMKPSAATVFDKSELKPMGRKGIETVLKPSQPEVNNSKGSSPLEKVLSRNNNNSATPPTPSAKQSSSPSYRSVGSSSIGIPLVGLTNKNEEKHNANDVEDEDGYQMVKPSLIRQRFNNNSTTVGNSFSKPSLPPTTSPRPKTVATSKPLFPNSYTSSSSSTTSSKNNSSTVPPTNRPSSTSISNLNIIASSSPMPRLPSRPVSAAGRKSRMSRMSTNSSLTSTPASSASPTSQITSEPVSPASKSASINPPVLKPKPQSSFIAANADIDRTDKSDSSSNTQQQQPNLPPRPSNKLRSTSNPPPLQSKPSMSSIELLLSRNEQQKSLQNTTKVAQSNTVPPILTKKPSVVPSPSNKTPDLPTRPNLDSWVKDNNNTSSETVKPSSLFNRSRSATSPVSSVGGQQDWSAIKGRPAPPQPHTQPPSARSKSPVSRSIPKPIINEASQSASSSITNGSGKKKATPPPPPPSRPPKNSSKGAQTRYELLFNSIHDDGYIDGETVQCIWIKSKLPNEDLANIWRECDFENKGLLDKEAFIEGMTKIDELLLQKQQLQQKQGTAAM